MPLLSLQACKFLLGLREEETDINTGSVFARSAVGPFDPVGKFSESAQAWMCMLIVLRRRGGIGTDQDLMEHCCILVHTAKPHAASQLSTVLAAWLHWYGRLDLQTAIQVKIISLVICSGV